jgi:RNA polymerase sigma-54 factor
VEDCFDEFTRKHYEKIQRRLDIDDYEALKEAIRLITHLNPKPGESGLSGGAAPHVLPDFIVTQAAGKLDLALNSRNAPELRVSRQYTEMLDAYARSDKKNRAARETVTFVKQKLDSARWFIDALKQRQQTLLKVMSAILEFQYEFFLEGDEARLHPMILKDIADVVEMDISTVSRVANSKYVQTEFGVFPLKFFFSEGIQNEAGEDVSTREVKQVLKHLIEAEDKAHPLSDEKLEELLAGKGFPIARRTVAKYREQLNLPVARLRREA